MEENIKKNAELVMKQLELTFDDESVKYVEEFIERQRVQVAPDQIGGLVNTLGSFLGECIIAQYGGSWQRDADGSVCVSFDEQNAVYPFAKVRKQFEHGLDDSVYAFYTTIPLLFGKEK